MSNSDLAVQQSQNLQLLETTGFLKDWVQDGGDSERLTVGGFGLCVAVVRLLLWIF